MSDHVMPQGAELILRCSLANIRYSSSAHAVISSASLNLAKGELAVVAAQSGTGKTTLLRAIAADPLISCSGTITFSDLNGFEGDIRQAIRLGKVAWVDPRPFFVSWQSVLENLYLPPRLNENIALKSFQITRLCHQLQLPESLLFCKPKQLSLGQRFRAGLIRALVREPQLLLIDEVFTGLDEKTAKIVADTLRLYISRGVRAAITITHRPTLLKELADTNYTLEETRGTKSTHLKRDLRT